MTEVKERLDAGAKDGLSGEHGEIIDEKLLVKILREYLKYAPNKDEAKKQVLELLENLDKQTKMINSIMARCMKS